MVTLRQLRYFDALADTLHFGRAAERCSITQPALSMQFKDLEQALGLELVERSGSSIRLTSDGAEALRRARTILAEMQDLLSFAKGRQGVLVGSFRLGIIPSVAPYVLPELLALAAERYPELSLVVRETLTAPLLAELSRGELDAALLALPVSDSRFETLPLFEDAFYIAVQARAAESWRADPDPQGRLGKAPLLLLEEGHCLRDQALDLCALDGGAARQALAATSLTTILQLVAAGHGVTLLPELCARVEVDRERVALVPFPGKPPRRTIGLAWRKQAAGHNIRAFSELVGTAADRVSRGV